MHDELIEKGMAAIASLPFSEQMAVVKLICTIYPKALEHKAVYNWACANAKDIAWLYKDWKP